jgi:mannosyltransferase OCH1-like enzyme
MTKFYEIPKHLLSRSKENYDQRIPKILWQTMKTKQVPQIMKEFSSSWTDLNPEYEYRFFDDSDIERCVMEEFPEYISAYKKIQQGAVKSDLWRYLILYKYGGVYADMDCRCVVPLKNWIRPAAEWVTQLGMNKDVCQWLIITVPYNPILKKAAEKSRENLLRPKTVCEYKGFKISKNQDIQFCEDASPVRILHPVMTLAGPPVLQEAAEECFASQPDSAIFRSIQIVCVSENVSCQMAGNVQHDYLNPEYLQALDKLSTPHYDSVQSRTSHRNLLLTLAMRFLEAIQSLFRK